MLQFDTFRLEYKPNTVALTARNKDSGRSFYWTHAEWKDLCGPQTLRAFVDGYHTMTRVDADMWTFVDTDSIPYTPAHGKAEVRFWRMHMPKQVWALLNGLLMAERERVLAKATETGERDPRIEIEVPMSVREDWARNFGQATGSVRREITPDVQARLDKDIAADSSGGLAKILDNWTRIARNSTREATQVAVLRISFDGMGYYVATYSPSGAAGMNGGWINHGTFDQPDWSAHT